jgi:hypothetical protein
MRYARKAAYCVAIVAALVTVGCGASRSGTTGESTESGALSGRPTPSLRGIKGESVTETATKAHLSAADCAALARIAERQTGTRLARRSTPRPPLSRCSLEGRRTQVNVYLDSGFAAHQRYENRITETDQFGYEDPATTPHPVPHVGEKAAYESGANWVPALGSLLAVRGKRWLTVTISVAGRSNRELRSMAAVLARAGFRLSA